jgi:carbonic anhydrase/acetyltransferase-like protein (isoleucine patch superfamily)
MPVTLESPSYPGRAHFHGKCEVGAITYFNGPSTVFHATIGRYCSIAPEVVIGPEEHPYHYLGTHSLFRGGGLKRYKKSKYYKRLCDAIEHAPPPISEP